MTDADLAVYLAMLRKDFLTFAHRCFVHLNPGASLSVNWHMEEMAFHLQECLDGKTRRLIINLPPRHLKSILSSVALPAFWLGHDPSAQIICLSYNKELADKMARDCRTVMQSEWYRAAFPRTRLLREAVNELTTTRHGVRLATSVEGGLTGRGADVIIIDDPMKPEEAASETGRANTKEWYSGTLLSRLNDKEKGCIILVMQRLHEDDLTGYVLELEPWTRLAFPAIAEEEEVHSYRTITGDKTYVRPAGEALHPARESLEVLNGLRATMGEATFSAQYQQQPLPPGGAIIKTKWIRRYDINDLRPQFVRIIQAWDTAVKAHERADYSVCTTWGVTADRQVYLLHVFRKQLEYPELKRAVLELHQAHKSDLILVEDKSSGSQLIQEYSRGGYLNIQACPVPPQDKIMRLDRHTIKFESGSVRVPNEAPWVDDYIRELTGFPGGKNDDQVDSTVIFLDWLSEWRLSIYDVLD